MEKSVVAALYLEHQKYICVGLYDTQKCWFCSPQSQQPKDSVPNVTILEPVAEKPSIFKL